MTDVKAEVVDQMVEVEIKIHAPAEEVFDFLVDQEKLLRWMGEEGTVDARPGGEFCVVISDDDTAMGHYVEIDRPKHVVFTWGWLGSDVVPPGSSTVTIDLRQDGDYTVVSLTHSGLPEGQSTSHMEGWLYFGGRLVEQAEKAVG